MNKSFTTYIVIVILLVSELSYSQQDAQYTQYMFNTVNVNPGYAGSREVLNIVALHRTQWYGLQGSPSTQTLALDTPLGTVERVGLGVSIINEAIGPINETYINIDASYTIPVSEKGKLSFGLKAVAHLFNVDFNKLNLFDLNDNSFHSVSNKFTPNIGAGAYYYTDKFYLGLSAPNLIETNFYNDDSLIGKELINYYLITGYVFDINDNIKFKPALLSKLVFGAPLQLDFSTNFMFYERFTFGLAYRWSAALSAITSFQITNSIALGFAYDRETTALGNREFNNGSYEVMLSVGLNKRSVRRVTPRFF